MAGESRACVLHLGSSLMHLAASQDLGQTSCRTVFHKHAHMAFERHTPLLGPLQLQGQTQLSV
jgi:hypothetical protein